MIICPVGVGLGDVMSPAIYFFNPTPTPMGSPMLKDPHHSQQHVGLHHAV